MKVERRTPLRALRFCYENASLANKQKLVGSIFPENFTIENDECRTARENEIICVLRGFQRDFDTKKPDRQSGFPVGYLRPESNRHTLRYTILSRARLPVPPLRLGFAKALKTSRNKALFNACPQSFSEGGCKYGQTLIFSQWTLQDFILSV